MLFEIFEITKVYNSFDFDFLNPPLNPKELKLTVL